jgi:hypothetical protein
VQAVSLLGAGTTFLIFGAGFGGGLMIAKSVMEPNQTAPSTASSSLLKNLETESFLILADRC